MEFLAGFNIFPTSTSVLTATTPHLYSANPMTWTISDDASGIITGLAFGVSLIMLF
jgi:hypothetical protein